jgi:transcriptional regulator with GAF, ATPase, and Fis domain
MRARSERNAMRTRQVGKSSVLSFSRFRLTVIGGPENGVQREGEELEVSVGTSPANSFVLQDATVSRHHCVISPTPRGFLLRDLDSTNGTLVDGVMVESAYLAPGSIIVLGETRLRFDRLDGEIAPPLSSHDRFESLLGVSPVMRHLFALLPRIAAADSTVLLEGETGTGKSLLAAAIHQRSARASEPLVQVDCGAIPPALIESELFGHEKGAFTGAHLSRVGAFESAQGGTIFLDEVGELPLELQPKLLRALEERTIKRVGSQRPIQLDVRVLAATNRDLRREVNRGSFRSDLFYRLNVVRLRVPPLRERPEDIPALVAHFYEQLAATPGERPPAELVAALSRQSWPGNARELRAAVERAVLFGDPARWSELGGDDAAETSLPGGETTSLPIAPAVSFRADKERAVARWERGYLAELMRGHGGNLSRAARAARMDRNHLRELLVKHKISLESD